MKIKPIVLFLTFCSGTYANAADTLTLRITGTVNVAAKCNFDLSSTSADLGTVDSTEFSGVGSTSAWKPLDIKSTGCTSGSYTMNWTYGGTADPDNPNLFKAEGGATGVGIELAWVYNTTNVPIKPGHTEGWGKRANGAVYPHVVRYRQTKPEITGGPAGANIVVTINYV